MGIEGSRRDFPMCNGTKEEKNYVRNYVRLDGVAYYRLRQHN